MRLLSEYAIAVHYGGPEEGGWWYERRSYVRTLHTLQSSIDAYTEARRRNAAVERDRDGRKRTSFLVEVTPGQWDNSREPRPHYE